VFTLKNISLSLLLVFAIALSCWSIILYHPAKMSVPDNDPKKLDSYMEEVSAIMFSKEGSPTLKVVTPRMVHYPENNTTDITKPRVTIFRKSPEPWFIDADFAKATNGMQSILFWSQVNIHHLADNENPATSLSTDTLTIFPSKQTAATSDAVTFVQPDTIVHAIGMLADMDAGTVKLLSQAQGEYDPAS
jgi:lipopolysaccharide export system protein LptC